MSARGYTQAQVEAIFAKATAAAEKNGGVTNWDAFVLGYVSSALGVNLGHCAEAVR